MCLRGGSHRAGTASCGRGRPSQGRKCKVDKLTLRACGESAVQDWESYLRLSRDVACELGLDRSEAGPCDLVSSLELGSKQVGL